MLKPYYKTENGVLYHGDCLEVMPLLDKVDLVLTDPPYGINIHKENKSRGLLAKPQDYGLCEWDKKIPTREIFLEMMIGSENQIIFGGNYFVEFLKNSSCWIVWDKDNGNTDFADCELAWTSFKTATRIVRFRWNGMLQGDMKHKEKRYHPTQKPIYVMNWILERYSSVNEVILDPFMGSGTTALACEDLGIKWIGIEKEQQYCDVIVKRLEAFNQQYRMEL